MRIFWKYPHSSSKSFSLAVAYLSLAAVIGLLPGCAIVKGFPEDPATSTAVYPQAGYQLGDDAIRQYNTETDASVKKTLRNEIIDARMAEIDRKFNDFERMLYKQGVGVGVGTDWAVLALSAASTVSRVPNTKTAISAVSTAIVGGAASFDKGAMFDKTMPALMAQMQADRDTVRAQIRGKEQLPVAQYSWFAAESDLISFAQAGTIPAAINSVSKDAGAKATTAKAVMQELTKGTYANTATTKALFKFWMPDGATINKANEAILQDWMSKHNFATGPGTITVFINTEEQEAARAQAVTDLKLK
ncbi:hypothetical protein ACO0LF_30685 [Undibacterium sp. Di27W]|uniref:hypothetical protein n=1 Tax=Undibacterium sp. Di27W TaxID=3413036 RepID=UPI003BF04738